MRDGTLLQSFQINTKSNTLLLPVAQAVVRPE
jgi:hypothetical protein